MSQLSQRVCASRLVSIMGESIKSASSLLTMPISSFPTLPLLPFRDLSLSEVVVFFAIVAGVVALTATLFTRFRNSTTIQTLALHALRRNGPIPSHIAFIMDGNRRWARRGGLDPHQGHPEGGEKLIESLQWCLEAGVRYVTVYAFSIENFKRPTREVNEIINLSLRKFHDFTKQRSIIHEKRVRVRVLGDLTLIRPDLRATMATVMEETACYTGGPTLNICFAYTARHDMATAVRDLVRLVRAGDLRAEQITESAVSACLSTGYAKGAHPQAPYPELLIRTSGETRLSDFLLWETEDTVMSFYPVLWPDLTTWDFVNLLLAYQAQCTGRTKGRLRRGLDYESCERALRTSRDHDTTEESALDVLSKSRDRYFEEIRRYSEGAGDGL